MLTTFLLSIGLSLSSTCCCADCECAVIDTDCVCDTCEVGTDQARSLLAEIPTDATSSCCEADCVDADCGDAQCCGG